MSNIDRFSSNKQVDTLDKAAGGVNEVTTTVSLMHLLRLFGLTAAIILNKRGKTPGQNPSTTSLEQVYLEALIYYDNIKRALSANRSIYEAQNNLYNRATTDEERDRRRIIMARNRVMTSVIMRA